MLIQLLGHILLGIEEPEEGEIVAALAGGVGGGQGGFYSCSNTEIKLDSASELAELAARAKTSLRKTAEPKEEPAMSTLGLSAQLPLV